MIPTALVLAAFFCYAPGAAFTQDAYKVAPQAYQLQFENRWVRVTRVHYGPHEKIPAHSHSRWPVAYVYLNDAGPIIFKHEGWAGDPVLTRPPTKARSFRLSPTTAVNEIHEVENSSDTPSDFLRVEFKTRPVGIKSLHGRFYPEPYAAGENFRKLEFENEQIRITRLACAPGKRLATLAGRSVPALLIVLAPAPAHVVGAEGRAKQEALKPGEAIWLANGRQARLENLGTSPLELLRVDFKSKPLGSTDGIK